MISFTIGNVILYIAYTIIIFNRYANHRYIKPTNIGIGQARRNCSTANANDYVKMIGGEYFR